MTKDARLILGFQRVGTEFKLVKNLLAGTDDGDLSSLTTTAQSNLVEAVNELKAAIDALEAGGVQYRGALAGTADLTSNATGNAYLDGAAEVNAGDLFKISATGTLTVSDGTITVNAGDNIYLNADKTDAAITVADVDLVDNTEAVTSVAGKLGAVTLNTADVAEDPSNLYYTAARVLAETLTGFTSGAGTITAADSVLGAIQKLDGNHAALVTELGPLDTDYVAVIDAALV